MPLTTYNTNILIIGAGIAGLAAAHRLKQSGFTVTILEARNRIGGRIHTDYSFSRPIDLGASWIHGHLNNPIAELANKCHSNYSLTDLRKSILLFDHTGKQIPQNEYLNFEAIFSKILHHAKAISFGQKHDISLQEALNLALKEFPLAKNAQSLLRNRLQELTGFMGMDPQYVSARYWDQEDPIQGEHYLLNDTYAPIIEFLAKDCKILLNHVVKEIRYNTNQVDVETSQGKFTADFAIITVPLSLLKSNSIVFNPQLSSEKIAAINRLAMGTMSKFILQFPTDFWQTSKHLIRYLADPYETFTMFVNYGYYLGQPLLVAMCAGQLSIKLEEFPDDYLLKLTMNKLRQLFGNDIPEPIAWKMTRWQQDPFSQGTYSYLPVGASGKDYEIMAEPVANRLFFAGEATYRRSPACTHGAYLSGIREAERIIKCS